MKLFYDSLIDKTKLLHLVHKAAKNDKEREKLAEKLDEIIHHAVLDVIFVHLHEKHHETFLTMLHKTPHSEELLIYIKQNGHPKIEKKIKNEVEKLFKEISKDIYS